MESLQISLEKTVFKPGEMISGAVIVVLKASIKVRAIKLTFYGFGATDRQECYLNQTLTLFECEGSYEHLNTGLHVYPFQYQLPQNLPASFMSKWRGKIKYNIKCVINQNWRRNNNAKLQFTVADYLDLNQHCTFGESVVASGEKVLSCCCCYVSDPIECTVTLDQTGYIPGDIIRVKALIHNKRTHFITRYPYKLKQYFHKRWHGKVERGNRVLWTAELSVPQIPATSHYTRIIRTEYFIVLFVRLWTGHNFKVLCPVKIGTIALRNPELISTASQGGYANIAAETQSQEEAATDAPPLYTEAINLSVAYIHTIPTQNPEGIKYAHVNPTYID